MALLLSLVLALSFLGGEATYFALQNKCKTTVWPGFQSGAGRAQIMNGGIELNPGETIHIKAPTGWSGRFWGRTGCSFDQFGKGNCATGDCNGMLECAGAGGIPPATLAEFTLNSPLDYYDISLVDGFNIPITVAPVAGGCKTVGCPSDLNQQCPHELQVQKDGCVVGCKSACLAFNKPEFCCTEAYSSPNVCKPSSYSVIFKDSCPQAYSYAYDDTSSLITCPGGDYIITFC